MSELTITDTALHLNYRPQEIKQRLEQIKTSLVQNCLELGRLLNEIQEDFIYRDWGYETFTEWLEQGSDLGVSHRESRYFQSIARRAAELQIPDDQLEKVKLSKLKEVMAFDVPAEHVKGLLEAAQSAPLAEVKEQVKKARGYGWNYRSIKLEDEALEKVYEPALERMRRRHGGYTVDGEPVDLSDSQCILYMCAEILAAPEEYQVDAVDSEFEDVVEHG